MLGKQLILRPHTHGDFRDEIFANSPTLIWSNKRILAKNIANFLWQVTDIDTREGLNLTHEFRVTT